jgi:hypothetical protein
MLPDAMLGYSHAVRILGVKWFARAPFAKCLRYTTARWGWLDRERLYIRITGHFV